VKCIRGVTAIFKRALTLEAATAIASAFLAFVVNTPFWSRFFTAVEPASVYEWLFALATAVIAFCGFYIAITILGTKWTFKPLLMVALPVTAAVTFFMREYGVVVDADMLQNAIQTNPEEVRDLLNPGQILYVGLLGVLPAYLVWRTPIAYREFWADVRVKTQWALAACAVMAVTFLPFFMNFTSVFRENPQLMMSLAPSNLTTAIRKLIKKNARLTPIVVAPFATDASRTALPPSHKKSVTVLVVGETARAANFSLNGYARDTNPRLKAVSGLINFPKVASCGTATAQSLPCMFSGLGRQNTPSNAGYTQENLLDVLKRAGLDVSWRENQAGCKAICARVPTDELTSKKTKAFMDMGENPDDFLLEGLEDKIKAQTADGVIVLHMMGSHGPAYYKRVPDNFRAFKPVCEQSQFSRCTTEEIVNAYDNTIFYTDHVLGELIKLLEKIDAGGIPTAMLYVSDHGESLGENGIYLHGMPYAFAPEFQKHVPMVMWLSPAYAAQSSLDTACLAKNATNPHSHDNIFHSILGLTAVTTKVYDAKLDIFAGCRK
jgi:lipid A ethanolaminephosphotransferase